jgi:hypothetical protein
LPGEVGPCRSAVGGVSRACCLVRPKGSLHTNRLPSRWTGCPTPSRPARASCSRPARPGRALGFGRGSSDSPFLRRLANLSNLVPETPRPPRSPAAARATSSSCLARTATTPRSTDTWRSGSPRRPMPRAAAPAPVTSSCSPRQRSPRLRPGLDEPRPHHELPPRPLPARHRASVPTSALRGRRATPKLGHARDARASPRSRRSG